MRPEIYDHALLADKKIAIHVNDLLEVGTINDRQAYTAWLLIAFCGKRYRRRGNFWGQSNNSPEVSCVLGEVQIATQSVTENTNVDGLLRHVISNTQDGNSALTRLVNQTNYATN